MKFENERDPEKKRRNGLLVGQQSKVPLSGK
jgi:hypothetical protein